MDLCTYENRESDAVALKLMVESTGRRVPDATIHIPSSGLDAEMTGWLGSRRNVRLHPDIDPTGGGWNVKISVIDQFATKLNGRVTWIDSDIIFQSDISHLLADLDDDTIVVAEEGYRPKDVGTGIRTRGLGLDVGRELGFTVNSCVVSVTPRHKALIEDWAALAVSDDYLRAQTVISEKRPRWYLSDQDLLGGLLGSSRHETIPVKRVRSGIDIAHALYPTDFTLSDRLLTVFRGEPPMIHCQGVKIWTLAEKDLTTPRVQYSPYRFAARAYDNIVQHAKTPWIANENRAVSILARLFPDRPSLIGLPLGALGVKQRLQGFRRSRAQGATKAPTDRANATKESRKRGLIE